jgi:hypothetical protein
MCSSFGEILTSVLIEKYDTKSESGRYKDAMDLALVFEDTGKKEKLRFGGLLIATGKNKFDTDIMHWFAERNGKVWSVIAGDRSDARHFTARRKGRCRRAAYIKVSKEQVPVLHDYGCENGHRGEDRERENDKEYECHRPHKKRIVQFPILSMGCENILPVYRW